MVAPAVDGGPPPSGAVPVDPSAGSPDQAPPAGPGGHWHEGEPPVFPEEVQGEDLLWLDAGGVAGWFTTRAPLADFTPLVFGVGYGHRVGRARLAWRLHAFSGALGDEPLTFIHGDLISVERLFSDGAVRPFWRVALSFALDLQGARRWVGGDGYFNEDNGASGGLGLTHGWGIDALLGDALFVRLAADLRLYGGAGRVGLLWAGHLGVGVLL
ncbi:MAG: hypothetical protein KC620_04855 [Myxococcales bacterium]|nr:hypothetical protein [Myxococcales bacterium]